jgi:hypothetical protein
VRAGSGLRQLDLGVTAGKSYSGYVWLRADPNRRRPTATVT